MKKTVISAAILSVLSTPALASEGILSELLTSKEGVHASVKAASYDVSFADDNGVMITGALGKSVDLKGNTGSLGLEAEFGMSVASAEYKYQSPYGTNYGHKVEADHLVIGGFVTYDYTINNEFFVGGRLGLAYADIDTKVTSYSGRSTFSNSDEGTSVNFSYGLHGGYRVNESFDVLLGFTTYDVVDRIEGGIQYHF